MTYNENNNKKRSPKKPKNSFGLYCKELRRILGINMSQAAKQIGFAQPYLTQLENGTEPLTSAALYKCLTGYMAFDGFTPENRLELVYEMLQVVESVEIDLSLVTIIHRENLLRLIAELLLNETYPTDTIGCIPWNRVSGYVNSLKEPPPTQADYLRIVSKQKLA